VQRQTKDRNSNISNWQYQNDCDYLKEGTDLHILANLKCEKNLQARRGLRDDLGKELAKKRQDPRIVRHNETNEAIEQIIDEIT